MEESNEKNDKITKIYDNIIYIYILKSIIILFIINYIIILSYKNNNFRNKNAQNKMGEYNLYKLSTFPQLSILILNIEKFIFNENTLINLIENIRNQTLKDIQIIFYISQQSNIEYINIIKNFVSIDNRIEIYLYKNINIFNNICDSFNKITGKYTNIIKEYISFENEALKNFYSSTYGKINIYLFIIK